MDRKPIILVSLLILLLLTIPSTLTVLGESLKESTSSPPTQLRPGDFMIMYPKDFLYNQGVRFHVAIYLKTTVTGKQRWVHAQGALDPIGVCWTTIPGAQINKILWKDFSYYYVHSSTSTQRTAVVKLLSKFPPNGWLWYDYQDIGHQSLDNYNPYDNEPYADEFYCSELVWAAYMKVTGGTLNIASATPQHNFYHRSGTRWYGLIWPDNLYMDADIRKFDPPPSNAPLL